MILEIKPKTNSEYHFLTSKGCTITQAVVWRSRPEYNNQQKLDFYKKAQTVLARAS